MTHLTNNQPMDNAAFLNESIRVFNEMKAINTDAISDGYHTFGELYKFRLLYNALLFNEWAAAGKYGVQKSMRHSDGELCFGGDWFIVCAMLPGLPSGLISNHYRIEDWDKFNVPIVGRSEYEYDGHTAADVMARLQHMCYVPTTEEPDDPPVLKTLLEQPRDANYVEMFMPLNHAGKNHEKP